MPYIGKQRRNYLDPLLLPLICKYNTAGELNYIITKLLLGTEPESYRDYNELIGVLECCKLELYRRTISVYEDRKKEKNGDVY